MFSRWKSITPKKIFYNGSNNLKTLKGIGSMTLNFKGRWSAILVFTYPFDYLIVNPLTLFDSFQSLWWFQKIIRYPYFRLGFVHFVSLYFCSLQLNLFATSSILWDYTWICCLFTKLKKINQKEVRLKFIFFDRGFPVFDRYSVVLKGPFQGGCISVWCVESSPMLYDIWISVVDNRAIWLVRSEWTYRNSWTR